MVDSCCCDCGAGGTVEDGIPVGELPEAPSDINTSAAQIVIASNTGTSGVAQLFPLTKLTDALNLHSVYVIKGNGAPSSLIPSQPKQQYFYIDEASPMLNVWEWNPDAQSWGVSYVMQIKGPQGRGIVDVTANPPVKGQDTSVIFTTANADGTDRESLKPISIASGNDGVSIGKIVQTPSNPDLGESTTLQIFDTDNKLIGTATLPAGQRGLTGASYGSCYLSNIDPPSDDNPFNPDGYDIGDIIFCKGSPSNVYQYEEGQNGQSGWVFQFAIGTVQTDESLTGDGSSGDKLSLNIQHDDTLSGIGTEGDKLSAKPAIDAATNSLEGKFLTLGAPEQTVTVPKTLDVSNMKGYTIGWTIAIDDDAVNLPNNLFLQAKRPDGTVDHGVAMSLAGISFFLNCTQYASDGKTQIKNRSFGIGSNGVVAVPEGISVNSPLINSITQDFELYLIAGPNERYLVTPYPDSPRTPAVVVNQRTGESVGGSITTKGTIKVTVPTTDIYLISSIGN